MSYIVPKDIPNCCGNCPYNYSSLMCKITKSEIDRDDEYRERLEDCQLIEIKTPHGRLGDLDELKSKFRHGNGDDDADSAWISTIRRFITQADTIIEAEE